MTVTGGIGLLGPTVTVLGLLLFVWGRRGDALFVWGAMLFTVLARNVVVELIGRARPDERLIQISSSSFPSGHTTASAFVAALLIMIGRPLLQRRWSRALLIVLAVGWALAVGTSRVALVVHWPTDVLGGWLFVVLCMSAASLVRQQLERRTSPAIVKNEG
ncbi:phosphatase PAP2 family protein [Kineosporia mesophila]|uniref:phosphatase PAP2 family protein n=1 Tax=Kineosporia mesophila TaxID=566012 RepID=UPI001E59C225|nr:phosphatase PAP2 family protein [Kineosporia mesophila]